ncbi:hypothetical protein X546_20545 [Brevibacillus borstelensis cifa_chp40]|nr:hypothetical protein X546_20545 [Brevibacillus borstelensis cifa_chp40]
MEWEQIDKYGEEFRAKVPGGWLVKICFEVAHDTSNGLQSGWDWRPALAFVPDPNHEWRIDR